MTSTHAGEGHSGELLLAKGWVNIVQEKEPEMSIDTSHEYVDGGRKNVFYGSGSWLGPNSGGFEFHAKDPGMGISQYTVRAVQGASLWEEEHNLFLDNECRGVQCPPEVNKGYAYSSQLPNGEDTLEGSVQDLGRGKGDLATEKLKVDNEPPYDLTFSGLPSNHEISDGQFLLLKASATDGVEGDAELGFGVDHVGGRWAADQRTAGLLLAGAVYR